MKHIFLFVLLLLVMSSVAAETSYVTDKLRLGVHLTRDTSGRAFTYLNSGDVVDILERDGQLTFVELEDERTGWVRGSFLQPEEPALRRVARVEAENARLATALEALRAKDSGQEIARLEAAARDAQSRAEVAENDRLELQSEIRELSADLAARRGSVPLSWLLAGVGGALILGAFVAWRWVDYRIRKRHGGFRIY